MLSNSKVKVYYKRAHIVTHTGLFSSLSCCSLEILVWSSPDTSQNVVHTPAALTPTCKLGRNAESSGCI
jgi:hypothetical protein